MGHLGGVGGVVNDVGVAGKGGANERGGTQHVDRTPDEQGAAAVPPPIRQSSTNMHEEPGWAEHSPEGAERREFEGRGASCWG